LVVAIAPMFPHSGRGPVSWLPTVKEVL
jgi:hypothetical protein